MMTKARLLRTLGELAKETDGEKAHSEADAALLDYLADPEITAAYHASNPGWCA
ncbi:hypothetical protein KAYACHO_56 [Mycobacterium phage KayaCho]|uniref:hypothetical protein n=1 Tax=Mycobacterium phage KayaCho TaxID=1340830 RepID=UPI000387EFE1|nr:hypothetical protein N846_gp56 [Mycobacterium phage KayaCho]AGT12960.1 hypothetical protein KAYACHO_56 [Mycobacterium phage KayaCho]